jgi:hypothetical protein
MPRCPYSAIACCKQLAKTGSHGLGAYGRSDLPTDAGGLPRIRLSLVGLVAILDLAYGAFPFTFNGQRRRRQIRVSGQRGSSSGRVAMMLVP